MVVVEAAVTVEAVAMEAVLVAEVEVSEVVVTERSVGEAEEKQASLQDRSAQRSCKDEHGACLSCAHGCAAQQMLSCPLMRVCILESRE